MKSLKTALVIALAASTMIGCSKVMDSEVAISENRFTGGISDKVLTQGLHQFATQKIIPVSKRNLVLPTIVATPIVHEKIAMKSFQMKVNYGIVPENAAIAYKTEKAQNMTTKDGDVYLLGYYVEYLAKAAINDVVSQYRALEVNDNRSKIETEIRDAINKKLDASGKSKFVRVNEISVIDIQPPSQITESSAAILKSEQDLKTRKNELEVAKVEQEKMKVLAQQADSQYVNLLNAQARVTEAEALKIAASKGNVSTIIVPHNFQSLGNVSK
ncbi:hypothetical protein ABNavy71_037 [Acinetobacter phage AB-Navy71]|nr:hypothetical protein ABNavy71_037 [Acinetobacter phage AB-Navy71]